MSTPSGFKLFCMNCSDFINPDKCPKCQHGKGCGTHLVSCHRAELSTDSAQLHFLTDVSSEVKADLERAVIGLGASFASQWEIIGETGRYYLFPCLLSDSSEDFNTNWHDLAQGASAEFIELLNHMGSGDFPEPVAITSIKIPDEEFEFPGYYCIFTDPIIPLEKLRKDVRDSYGSIDVKRRALTRNQAIHEVYSVNNQNNGFGRFFWGRGLTENAICPWASLDSRIFAKWIYHHLASVSENVSDVWVEDQSSKGIEVTQFRHSGELIPTETGKGYSGYILRVNNVVLPPGWSSETVLELAKSTQDFLDLIRSFRYSLMDRGTGIVRSSAEGNDIPFLDFLRENFPEHDFLIKHLVEHSSSSGTRFWPFLDSHSMQVFSSIDGVHWDCVDTKFDPSFGAYTSEAENIHFYDTRVNWAKTNFDEVDHDAFFKRLRKQDEKCLDPKVAPLLFEKWYPNKFPHKFPH